MRRLAFGEADSKHRTRAEIEAAWRDLPSLVVTERDTNQRTGELGWRVLPVEAVREGAASSE